MLLSNTQVITLNLGDTEGKKLSGPSSLCIVDIQQHMYTYVHGILAKFQTLQHTIHFHNTLSKNVQLMFSK